MSRETMSSHSIKYDTLEVLNRTNSVRAFGSTLILSLIFTVFIVIANFSKGYASHIIAINVLLGFFIAFNVGMAVLGFFLLKNHEKDKLNMYHKGVFAFTGLSAMVVAGLDMTVTNSILIPVAGAIYMALVPVLQRKERRLYLYIMAVGMVITAVIAEMNLRTIMEVVILGAMSAVLGNIFQDRALEHERVSQKLKAKTVSSESDPLTGLSNRRGLSHKVSVLWPYCARNNGTVGVIEIDVDFFKKYNDRFGHPAGDRCLKQIAKTIRNSVKRGTDIVARTGGEEFMVFVHEMSEAEVVALALRIREAIDGEQIPHAYVGISNYVTVSMGVAIMVPGADNTFEQLYEEADRALYTAKSSGRHCVVCGNRIYGRMKNGLGAVINS